jgi:hypothetical protein
VVLLDVREEFIQKRASDLIGTGVIWTNELLATGSLTLTV